MSRFSYGFNNPIKYTDPTGHSPTECSPEDPCDGDSGSRGVNGRGNGTDNLQCDIDPSNPNCNSDETEPHNNSTVGTTNATTQLLYDPCAGLDPSGIIYGMCQVDKSAPKIKSCSVGWVSALTTSDGSCGHAGFNANAIVDPFAWSHVLEPIGSGVFLMVAGVVMIQLGAGICTTAVGCVIGVPMLILPGVAGIVGGSIFAYSGVFIFGKQYMDDIFIIER